MTSFMEYNYFWVPVVACHVGSILGAWIYRLFIELHWPNEQYNDGPDGSGQQGESENLTDGQNFYARKILARMQRV